MPSNMEITGRNALIAAGISLAVAALLSVLFLLMAALMGFVDGAERGVRGSFDLWELVVGLARLLLILSIFAGGPVFIVTFALLQRFRIKY
jgi:hypothetical protein